jgi:hypothetical protein
MAIAAIVTGAVSIPLLLIIALILAIGVLIYLLITQWDSLSTTVKQIGFIIGFYFDQLKERISTTIKQLGFIISYYFEQAASSFKEAFFSALDAVQGKFESIFNGIKSFLKGIINGIIDVINGMIAGIVNGINAITASFNTVGSVLPGFAPLPTIEAYQLPHLAKGAVIPPNAQFAAVLGDQRSGRNIEAPEGLIRQIVSEEIGKITADIQIEFVGSLASLVRELHPHIKSENVRVGGSLVKSGANV